MKYLWILLLSLSAWGQVGGFPVSSSAGGFVIVVGPGSVSTPAGTVVVYGGGTKTLTANATNYGFVDNTGTVSVNTTGVPAGDYPIFQAVTGATDTDPITITDLRPSVFFGPTGGGGTFFQVPTSSTSTAFGGGLFSWNYSTATSHGTTDNELAEGYNMGPQLGRLNTALPSIGTTDEVDFNDGTHHWLETHLDSVSANNGLRHFIFSRSLDNQALADAALLIGPDAASLFTIGAGPTQIFRDDPTGTAVFTGVINVNNSSTTTTGAPTLSLTNNPSTTKDSVDINGSLGSPIFYLGSIGNVGEGIMGLRAGASNANGAEIDLFSNADVTQRHILFDLDNSGDLVVRQVAADSGQMFFDFRNQINFRDQGNADALEATLTPAGAFAPKKLNQQATNNFAGTCAMAAGTSCTATLTASFTAPICQVTPQGTSAIAGACSVSGTTVTITAASSNSLTWAYMVVGNPN